MDHHTYHYIAKAADALTATGAHTQSLSADQHLIALSDLAIIAGLLVSSPPRLVASSPLGHRGRPLATGRAARR